MADMYLPVNADDANRQQQTARTFYLIGDFFKGIDAVRRMEPQMVNDSGLLGPSQSGMDVGLGQGGELYIRGRSGQIAATQQTPAQPGAVAAMTANPLLLLALAGVAAWVLYRWAK